MKRAGWIAGTGIVGSLVVANLTAEAIHGPEWAMYVVGAVLGLAWIAAAMCLAKWADRRIEREHQAARREAQVREIATLKENYPDTRMDAYWTAKAAADARRALDAGVRPDDV